MNLKSIILVYSTLTFSTITSIKGLTTLDAANTKVIDGFVCKHLKDLTMQRIQSSLAEQNTLENHCISEVNKTIEQCTACSRSTCGSPAPVPVIITHTVSSSDKIKDILSSLSGVNVAVGLTQPLVDSVKHVIDGLSHGVQHVGHEISHGIHHIGHEIHHIFGKRFATCALECPSCQKVNSNDTNVVKRNVCGNDYITKTHALETLVPKFQEVSKAIQNRGVIQKVEYDIASLHQNGGSITFSTVYITAKVNGGLHRFRPTGAYELMQIDSSSAKWAADVLKLFLP